MPNPEPLEFVNRTDELRMLRERVFPQRAKGTVTFLRSPSGFGKSRLADRLIDQIGADGPTCIVVDPAIRSRSRSDRIYAWFYVQRAAEQGARRRKAGCQGFRTFGQFLRETERPRINWRRVYENAKGVAGLRFPVRLAVELVENILKIGQYRPEGLLQEDSRYAGETAQEYVRALASFRPTLFVVRESQHIDPESLRFFLLLVEETTFCSAIFEYTHPKNEFSEEHQKIIEETVTARSSLGLIDLLRLNLREFRYLLKKYAPSDKLVESVAELKWDGNLRIIRELNYRIMVERNESASATLDLTSTIRKNVGALPRRQKLLLALVAVHTEAIDRNTLGAVVSRIDRTEAAANVSADIAALQEGEGYLRVTGSNIGLADEDLLEGISSTPGMIALRNLAAVGLRDFYIEVINGKTFGHVQLHAALRQAVALCAKTGDIFALRDLVRTIDCAARQAHDQTLYISIISDVVLGGTGLSELERKELTGWASAAAYEAGNFATAAKLIESWPERQIHELALLACCYGELNRHAEALDLAERMRADFHERHHDWALMANLIKCLSLFALGQKRDTTALHESLRNDRKASTSPLYGFVLRFTELVQDFPECTPDVLASVELFQQHGLVKSAAYSQLAGAMHVAYTGQIEIARDLLAKAAAQLAPYVRDQQIILNNGVVVELLSAAPDLKACIERLGTALFTPGDDFSRLTLHNNRLICFARTGERDRAAHTIDIIDGILKAPGFGNRDIFITVGFNVSRYYASIDEPDKAARYRAVALNVGLDQSCYRSYWKVRFGLAEAADSKFDFLLKQPYHPDYLSHWLIDLDAVEMLKAAPAQ